MLSLECPRCGVRAFGDVEEVDSWAERHVKQCTGWNEARRAEVLP